MARAIAGPDAVTVAAAHHHDVTVAHRQPVGPAMDRVERLDLFQVAISGHVDASGIT